MRPIRADRSASRSTTFAAVALERSFSSRSRRYNSRVSARATSFASDRYADLLVLVCVLVFDFESDWDTISRAIAWPMPNFEGADFECDTVPGTLSPAARASRRDTADACWLDAVVSADRLCACPAPSSSNSSAVVTGAVRNVPGTGTRPPLELYFFPYPATEARRYPRREATSCLDSGDGERLIRCCTRSGENSRRTRETRRPPCSSPAGDCRNDDCFKGVTTPAGLALALALALTDNAGGPDTDEGSPSSSAAASACASSCLS